MVFANASQTGYSMIVGTRIEGFVTILTVISSVILAIVITRPVKGLAIDNDDSIAYGNQYYFSWITLFSSIVLFERYITASSNFTISQSAIWKTRTFPMWVCLFFAYIMILASCSDYHLMLCKGDEKIQPFCRRCVWGVVVGIIGAVISGGILCMKIVSGFAAPFLIEVGMNFWMCLISIIQVTFLTSDDGPAAAIGNLFYSSWLALLLTFAIASACHEDYLSAVDTQHQPVSTAEMPTLGQVLGHSDEDNEPRGNSDESSENETKQAHEVEP